VVRQGYFGGITYMRGLQEYRDLICLDINAAYAHAMRAGVPIGTPTLTHKEYPGQPAYYRVKVHCPYNIPMAFIPCPGGKGRTLWPRGEFVTTITSRELYMGRRLGYTFEVIDGVLFDEYAYPFDAFINLCERIEIPNKGLALGDVVKGLRTSLYGRFGMNPEQTEYKLAAECPEGYSVVAVERSNRYEQVPNLYMREVIADRAEMMPHWAAWITANARLSLVHYHEKLGFENVVYSDTDSMHVERSVVQRAIASGAIAISPKYGDVKFQEEYQTWQAISPKSYFGITLDGREITSGPRAYPRMRRPMM
jgi:hypothetical protein